MRKGTLAAAAALLGIAAVVWWAASPYLTLWQLREAVVAEDEEALRRIVDFPRVRADLAEDLRGAVGPEIEERLGDRGLGGLGRILGDAAVEEIVEAYVSPDGIFALARGRDPRSGSSGAGGEPPDFTIQRTGFDTFTLTTEAPAGASPTFVFERRGLGWRMVGIETGLGDGEA